MDPEVSEPAQEIETSEGGRRQLESERKRQCVLESARRCFGELGFAGATVAAIAADAGVSNGLLYQFFRNKEHLFEVVSVERLEQGNYRLARLVG